LEQLNKKVGKLAAVVTESLEQPFLKDFTCYNRRTTHITDVKAAFKLFEFVSKTIRELSFKYSN